MPSSRTRGKPWRLWTKRGLYERIGVVVEDYEKKLRELETIRWLAQDFVWSCPDIPDHPTAQRLVAALQPSEQDAQNSDSRKDET